MNRSTITPIKTPAVEPPPERVLELAFLPLHKRALGAGMGAGAGLVVFLFTIVHVVRQPDDPFPLTLLAQYFYGYRVSVQGAFVGLFWAGVAGFVGGWFFAFCRNFAMAMTAFMIRTRAELKEMREFLDHI